MKDAVKGMEWNNYVDLESGGKQIQIYRNFITITNFHVYAKLFFTIFIGQM